MNVLTRIRTGSRTIDCALATTRQERAAVQAHAPTGMTGLAQGLAIDIELRRNLRRIDWMKPAGLPLDVVAYTGTTPAPTFVVAGAGELRERAQGLDGIVRHGDTSPDAMREKARLVMATMQERLRALGGAWDGCWR